MKTALKIVFTGLCLFAITFCQQGVSGTEQRIKRANTFNKPADVLKKIASASKALNFSDSMRRYLKKNGYSSQLFFVADMGLHMYIKRFYAIDADSGKILYSCLVAHGKGGGSKWDSVAFSNIPGSLCSSKGRYKIGKSYMGEFGKGYKLHGLDNSNNNAFRRLVVFHSFSTQTAEEYSRPSYMSSGCPMLAPRDFKYCDSLIQRVKKPVMLVIY